MHSWLFVPLVLAMVLTSLLGMFPLATLAAAAGLGWAAARRERAWARRSLAAVALYLAAAAVIGLEHRRWTDWHYSGSALRAGMTTQEVESALRRRSPRVEKIRFDRKAPDAYEVFPPGLAGFAEGLRVPLPELYYVDVEFGPDGRLDRFRSWSD